MYTFGERDEIQIQYKFIDENNPESDAFKITWGEFRLYVLGVDLCEFNRDGIVCGYQANLFWITEWLCKNLRYIVGYDPFPIPVSGNSAQELLKNACILEAELEERSECEMLLVNQAKFEWLCRHCWNQYCGGTVLPFLLLRKNGDCIEISWDNSSWVDRGVSYTSSVGCQFIQIDKFKNVIIGFLKSYLNEWEENASRHNKVISVLSEWRGYLSIFA